VHKSLNIENLALDELKVNNITGQSINATTVTVGQQNVTLLNVNDITGDVATFQTLHVQNMDAKLIDAVTTNSTNVNGAHINGANVNGNNVNGINVNATTLNATTGNIETLNATNANITTATVGVLTSTTSNSTTSNDTTLNATTANITTLNAGHINVTDATNQLTLGTGNTTTINSTAPAASRIYTLPDVLANAIFVMTQGDQTIAGTKTFSGNIQLATTGGTPANLNFYSETTQSPFSMTCTASAVFPGTFSTTVQYVRIGKIVTMLFTGFSTAGGGGAAGNIIANGTGGTSLVPLEYRPPITFKNLTTVENSGPPATTVGTVQISAAGVMTFTRASGINTTEQTFQTGGTLGVSSFQAAWIAA
jgi:hypothetical protein